MDVRCERCGTEYHLDPARLGSNEVTVRCTACGHVFSLGAPTSSGVRSVQPPSPNDWLVRTQAGRMITFRELTTLQKWIVEGRIDRDDEISRNGETWKRLGNIHELEPFFSVYERARALNDLVEGQEGAALRGSELLAPLDIPDVRPSMIDRGLEATTPSAVASPAPRPMPSESPIPKGSVHYDEGSGIFGIPVSPPRANTAPPRANTAPPRANTAPPRAPTAPPRAPTAPPAFGEDLPAEPSFAGTPAAELRAVRRFGPSPYDDVSPPPAAFPGTLSHVSAFTGDLSFSEVPKPSPPRRRGALWLAMVGLIGVGGVVVGGGIARFGSEMLAANAEKEGTSPASRTWLDSARAALDLDTEAGRARALSTLSDAESALPEDADVVSHRALVGALEAIALQRRAERLDVEAQAVDESLTEWKRAVRIARRRGRSPPPRPEAPDPAQFRTRARALRADAHAQLEDVGPWLDRARALEAEALGPEVALAAYLLATDNREALAPQLDRLERYGDASPAEVEFYGPYAELLLGAGGAAAKHDDEAVTHLRAALEARPELSAARVLLGRVLIRKGELSAAREVLDPVLDVTPGHPEANALFSEIARLESVPEEKKKPARAPPAREPEKVSTPSEPRSFEEWLSLAHRRRNAGQVSAALDAYGAAGELDGSSAEPLVGKGWCFLDLGRPRLARLSFDRALEQNARFAEAWLGKAEAALRLEDGETALDAYKQYLDKAPSRAPDRRVAERKIQQLEAARASAGASELATSASTTVASP